MTSSIMFPQNVESSSYNDREYFLPHGGEFSGHTRQKPKGMKSLKKNSTLPIGQSSSGKAEPCISDLKTTYGGNATTLWQKVHC